MRPSLGKWLPRILLILVIPALFYLIRGVLCPFLLAFFLAYLIEPLVLAIHRRGASRGMAIITIFTVALLLTVVLVAVVVPLLVTDLQKAADVLPGELERLAKAGHRLTELYRRMHMPLNVRSVVDHLAAQLTDKIEKTVGGAITLLLRLLTGSIMLLIVPFIAYYISRDFIKAKASFYAWLQKRTKPDWLAKAVAVDRVLRAYFRGQMLEFLVMSALLSLGMTLLGIKFALLLGIIAGIFNVIPYFGPILGAIPAVLIALTRSPWHALYVVILFAASNQIEASFLVPTVIGGRVGLHPLLVIFVILLGGQFFGLLGMVFAVPIAAAVKVVAYESLRKITMPDDGLTTPEASAMMKKSEKAPETSDDCE